MRGGFERRRTRLATIWSVMAVMAAVVAVLATEWRDVPWLLVIGFTVAAASLTRWSSLETTRMEFDPSTPFIVGTAVAVGPGAAPVILLLQAAVSTVVDARSHRRHVHHGLINLGAISTWHILLALLVRPMLDVANSTSTPVARWWAIGFGIALITALAVIFNYLTVALTVTSLYGASAAPPDGAVAQNLNDIGAATGIGLAVIAAGANGWLLLLAVALTTVYIQHAASQRHQRAEATSLEISGEVTAAERRGSLPGHTERVVDMVTALDPSEQARIAAWCHGVFSAGLPHMCGGVRHDPGLRTRMRALPRFRATERHIPIDGIPLDTELSHLIAAACGWDSRRLDGSPVRTPDDLIYTLGIDRPVVDRIVDLDPGWVTPLERRRSDTSKPR